MKYLNLFTLLLVSIVAKAESVQMAETMRSDGKIYVVIAVLAIILLGLIVYLITIDRKLGKLEKEINN
ncbi:MAG: CcmD family protein [Vicingaceae bacterium]|jgi:CcmD family protein